MSSSDRGRRRFLEQAAASAVVPALAWPALASASTATSLQLPAAPPPPKPVPPGTLKFGVIGINHGHVYGQVGAMLRGGGELASFYAVEPDLKAQFLKRYPKVKEARSESEVIEDPQIKLVLSAAIPDQRAPLGVRVMRHGKDYLADKPGVTTLEQLAEVRRVRNETGRIYSIMYSERFENRATVRAAELVRAGAIGRVLQTIGLGPHRMNVATRPAWFFERERFGGILCDIASHQADQFLHFTGSKSADLVAAQVGNLAHPQYPSFEDFGDLLLRGDGGVGYIRVDWFTPDGLSTWGDGRLTILGTEGFIEVRKNVDIAGRGNGSHLFLVDGKETRYVDCTDVTLPYGTQLAHDVLERTETAMSQTHCFLATELVLKAQQQARRLGSRG